MQAKKISIAVASVSEKKSLKVFSILKATIEFLPPRTITTTERTL